MNSPTSPPPLVTPPNTQFVELHPEAALRLAWTLRLRDVARAVFRVLVAERAIERLGLGPCTPHLYHAQAQAGADDDGPYNHHPYPAANFTTTTTLFGRPRRRDQDLPDEMERAVERAARSLTARARHACAQLFSVGTTTTTTTTTATSGADVFDWLGVEQWRVLRQIQNSSDNAGVRDAAATLEAGLRAEFGAALVRACNVDPDTAGLDTAGLNPAAGSGLLCYLPVNPPRRLGIGSSSRIRSVTEEEREKLRPPYAKFDRDRRCAAPWGAPPGFVPTALLYVGLAPAQRLLTPVFWRRLVAAVADFTRSRTGPRAPGHASVVALDASILNRLILSTATPTPTPIPAVPLPSYFTITTTHAEQQQQQQQWDIGHDPDSATEAAEAPPSPASTTTTVPTYWAPPQPQPAPTRPRHIVPMPAGPLYEDPPDQPQPPPFDLAHFDTELEVAVRRLAARWTTRRDDLEVPIVRMDYLSLCLTEEDEFRFLPAWAGGGGGSEQQQHGKKEEGDDDHRGNGGSDDKDSGAGGNIPDAA